MRSTSKFRKKIQFDEFRADVIRTGIDKKQIPDGMKRVIRTIQFHPIDPEVRFRMDAEIRKGIPESIFKKKQKNTRIPEAEVNDGGWVDTVDKLI